LSTHLRLDLPSGLFPHQYPIRIPLLPIRATCPAHLVLNRYMRQKEERNLYEMKGSRIRDSVSRFYAKALYSCQPYLMFLAIGLERDLGRESWLRSVMYVVLLKHNILF
jgi:hypothetical protein